MFRCDEEMFCFYLTGIRIYIFTSAVEKGLMDLLRLLRQSLLELGIDGSVLHPVSITGCNMTHKIFEANVFLQRDISLSLK